MSKKTLYLLLASLSFAGYAWLAWNSAGFASHFPGLGTCMFKAGTHVPCPSCGTTRAILLMLHGDVWGSLHLNPIGALLLFALVVIPFWILTDIILKAESLHRWYMTTERALKQNAWISVPLIFLILVNWFWNIAKGL